jgi:hypothetical protein
MVFFIALKALLDKALSIFTRVKTSEAQISSSDLGFAAAMGSPVVISKTACARDSLRLMFCILDSRLLKKIGIAVAARTPEHARMKRIAVVTGLWRERVTAGRELRLPGVQLTDTLHLTAIPFRQLCSNRAARIRRERMAIRYARGTFPPV